ncbi:MAG: hypothetical protein RLZZ354_71 [Pseudomonadota bacterium]
MFKFFIIFILFSKVSVCQNHLDTIRNTDFCSIYYETTDLEIIQRKLPVFQIHDSLSALLKEKIFECFSKENNIFSCYNFVPSTKMKSTYYLSIEVDYPLTNSDSIGGVFFVSNIPFFIDQKSVENSTLFTQIDSIIVRRNKLKKDFNSCVKWRFRPY